MWRLQLCMAVPLVLAGCAFQYRFDPHAKAGAPLDPSFQSSADLIEVVGTEHANRPYRQVGIVHAPGSMEERDAIAELKRRARALGGDALLNVRKRSAGSTANRTASSPGDAPWQAAVIVWTDKQGSGQAGGRLLPTQTAPPPPRRRWS